MSPAMRLEKQQDQTLQSLARAFEALLLTAHELSSKEKSLQQRLNYAHDEYIKLAHELPGGPNADTNVVSETILGRHAESEGHPDQLLNIEDVVNSLKDTVPVRDQIIGAISDGLRSYQTIAASYGNKLLRNKVGSCLVAAAKETLGSLERDFTTEGTTQGSLRCPFSNIRNNFTEENSPKETEDFANVQNGDTCEHEDLDPIKAEPSDRCSGGVAPAPSSNGRCPVSICPIRFLDKHSPEEIAEFVERHKHEIPRSHAICVRRYQRDAESMRKLDAKYGSLINMIRGLGVKHQVFLPRQGQDENPPENSTSDKRIEMWAEDVSLNSPDQERDPNTAVPEPTPDTLEEDRASHFDRPLREVRVGESPSRPWGIPITHLSDRHEVKTDSPRSSILSSHGPGGQQQAKYANDTTVTSPEVLNLNPISSATLNSRCPLGHVPNAPQRATGTKETVSPDHQDRVAQNQEASASPLIMETLSAKTVQPPGVVFNGPVFFGYSAEQAASLMRELGISSVAK